MLLDDAVRTAVAQLREAGFEKPYACAILTGTGLGALADRLSDDTSVSYAEIDGFPRPGVSGHAGRLHRGILGGRAVLVLEGRAHAYETGDAAAMRVPIAVASALGANLLLLTNSSGSLKPEIGPGSLVVISDHINLSGLNPLIGEPSDRRFVPMVDAYDPKLRASMHAAAQSRRTALHEGIYAWSSGPSFETPAEIRMMRTLGADLVGMSTVPETILARFHGMRVAALSVVTNLAAGLEGGDPHHDETKAVAARAADRLADLITEFIAHQPENARKTRANP